MRLDLSCFNWNISIRQGKTAQCAKVRLSCERHFFVLLLVDRLVFNILYKAKCNNTVMLFCCCLSFDLFISSGPLASAELAGASLIRAYYLLMHVVVCPIVFDDVVGILRDPFVLAAVSTDTFSLAQRMGLIGSLLANDIAIHLCATELADPILHLGDDLSVPIIAQVFILCLCIFIHYIPFMFAAIALPPKHAVT